MSIASSCYVSMNISMQLTWPQESHCEPTEVIRRLQSLQTVPEVYHDNSLVPVPRLPQKNAAQVYQTEHLLTMS